VPDYLFLMHNDTPKQQDESGNEAWGSYLGKLEASGNFQGGSAIGGGLCFRKRDAAPAITGHLSGFLRISATIIDDARTIIVGNPVFEAGGTVEIRELPRSD
jgi:hypothetical protein